MNYSNRGRPYKKGYYNVMTLIKGIKLDNPILESFERQNRAKKL
jgi:hypothetical protein